MPENREDVLRDLGIRIRQKREELGLSLRDVHDGTKIRAQFLEGIEKGDYTEFPGTVYVRGFIRTYLRFLGAEELWEGFLRVLDEGNTSECAGEMVLGTCTSPARGFKPASRFWVFVILMLVVIGSSWYVWYTWNTSDVPPLSITEVPANGGGSGTSTPGDQPSGKDSVGETRAEADRPAPETPPGKEGALPQAGAVSRDLAAATPPGMTVPPTAAELVGKAVPQTPAAPAATPDANKTKELVVNASADCWVRVQQGTKTLFERTLCCHRCPRARSP